MKKKTKTKQQLLLEMEEFRTRLNVSEQRLEEANERMQAEMTERKRVGEDFVRAQQHAESIVETIREPLLVLTADLKVISANQSFYQTFKVTPEETEGRFIYSVGNHQWDIPALRKLLEEIIPQNSQFTGFEVDHEFPSIGRKMMFLNVRRIYRQGKGTEMILLAIEDVTERNQAREVLEVSETRYRRLFETAQDGILIIDADTGKISDVNPFLIQMLGYSHEDFLGRKLWEIGTFRDIEASRTAFSELQTRGYVRYEDLPLQTRDGRSIAVEFVSNVYLVDHQKVIQCNIRDITDRKQAEEKLLESEIKYRIVSDNTYDWEFWLSPEGQPIYTSPSCKRIAGYDSVEFMADPNLFHRILHPDDRSGFDSHWRDVVQKMIPGEMEFRIMRSDGSCRWIGQVCQPVFDGGRFLGTRGSNRDITERKLAEEERERLIHSLEDALAKIRRLHGILPICASCKKIRDDEGYWNQLEAYIEEHSEAEFTHGLCPDCMKKLYGISLDEDGNYKRE